LTAPAPNGGVDNKYSSTQNHYTLSASWVSVTFPEATGRLSHDVG
jgi:hypothetical protein